MGDTVSSTRTTPNPPRQEVPAMFVENAPAELRPGYPMVCVDWLVGVSPCDVADIGCGSGRLTETLIFYGHRINAVDVDGEALTQLQSELPSVPTYCAPAEDTGLPDASVDVAVFAQSWHHVDSSAVATELRRILRPGGRVALAWNLLDPDVEWASELQSVMHVGDGDAALDSASSYAPAPLPAGFTPWETTTFRWSHQITLEQLTSLPATRREFTQASAEDQARVTEAVNRVLGERFADRAENEPVELPYVTLCFRAHVA